MDEREEELEDYPSIYDTQFGRNVVINPEYMTDLADSISVLMGRNEPGDKALLAKLREQYRRAKEKLSSW